MSRLLDPKKKGGSFPFRYTPSHATNVRETFERARREQDQRPPNVRHINPKARKS